MKKDLYRAVTERLLTLADTDGNPIIRKTGLWNNQLSFAQAEAQADLPAVFVEFAPMQWKSIGGKRLDTLASIHLHIISPRPATEEEALAGFDLPEQIADCLYGLKGTCFSSLVRTSSETNYDNGDAREEIESYRAYLIR